MIRVRGDMIAGEQIMKLTLLKTYKLAGFDDLPEDKRPEIRYRMPTAGAVLEWERKSSEVRAKNARLTEGRARKARGMLAGRSVRFDISGLPEGATCEVSISPAGRDVNAEIEFEHEFVRDDDGTALLLWKPTVVDPVPLSEEDIEHDILFLIEHIEDIRNHPYDSTGQFVWRDASDEEKRLAVTSMGLTPLQSIINLQTLAGVVVTGLDSGQKKDSERNSDDG